MTASINTRARSLLSRLLVALTIGLLTLTLGASAVFAGNGSHGAGAVAYAAPVVSTDGGQGSLNADCDDDDDDECEEGGGGLPATDTAPELSTGSTSGTGSPVSPLFLLLVAGVTGGAMKLASRRTN